MIRYTQMRGKGIIRIMMAAALALGLGSGVSLARDSGLSRSKEDAELRLDVIHRKMDSIRTTERRPTVALVLSGGGAKGAAHVGVIRYLESIGMPVDIVLGTSMGGLVGGIYSLGYSAGQLDTLIRNIDWNVALSDDIPREKKSYAAMRYKKKYLLSFPFYYERDEYLHQKEEDMRFSRKSDDLRFAAGEADPLELVKGNFFGSLPSGMLYGQNVNNILSSLSVGYQDDIDFYDLPVPFLCVATDLVSGRAKIWSEGKLNVALRSTMSIPALFAPVRTDGMVLVDGGMRNNYPTDLAAKVGADVIIGVNVSSSYREYGDINNLVDIIGAGVDMLGRSSYENNIDIPDVTISPVLDGYDMLSFDAASIDTIINRGYEAALAVAPALDSLKAVIGSATMTLAGRPADDIRDKKVLVDGIEITGVNSKESLYLMKKLGLKAGVKLGMKDIEDAEATIFSTKSFDYVNYELLGDAEPYRLRFLCKKGPKHQLGLSGRFDSEEIVSVLVNVGLNTHKLQGSSYDFTAKVGTNPYGNFTYTYKGTGGMTVNASASVRYTDRNMFSIGDNNFKINFFDVRQEIFLSNIEWSNFYIKTGLRNDYYKVSSMMAEQSPGDYDPKQLSNDYVSVFANAKRDDRDKPYFPTRGSELGLYYEWVFGGFPNKINKFHVFELNASTVVGGDDFAFIPAFDARYLYGHSIPVSYVNTIGGSVRGRYLDQQIPFIGIDNAAAMGNLLGVARTDFRFKLAKNSYLTAMANYAVTCEDFKDFLRWGENVYDTIGVGLQFAYNTIVGPLGLNIHWSDYKHKVGVYVFLGLEF